MQVEQKAKEQTDPDAVTNEDASNRNTKQEPTLGRELCEWKGKIEESTQNNETVTSIQIILFVFALLLFTLLFYTVIADKDRTTKAIVSTILLTTLLISAIDPLTIKNLTVDKVKSLLNDINLQKRTLVLF